MVVRSVPGSPQRLDQVRRRRMHGPTIEEHNSTGSTPANRNRPRSNGPVGLGETDSAFRALLSLADCLSASDASTRVVLCFATPPLTGDERIDAAIAAIGPRFTFGRNAFHHLFL
jgi:hypothetical protein